MADGSNIEWTEATWNPLTGCTKVSQGCKNCYAERFAKRLQIMGMERYRNGFQLTIHDDLVNLPLRWRQPRLIFVNSMSDLFHEKVPVAFIRQVFETMERCPHHTFQVLTKRSKRLAKIAGSLPWPQNVWMGVTVENDDVTHRINDLQKVSASIRFLSCEPLLGPLDNLPLDGIHWVIVGGESGQNARPLKKDWVDSILQQCREAKVPFFFKQWGGVRKHVNGRKLHGKTYDEMPFPAPHSPIVARLEPALV